MSILNKIQIVLCSDEPEKEIEEHKDEFIKNDVYFLFFDLKHTSRFQDIVRIYDKNGYSIFEFMKYENTILLPMQSDKINIIADTTIDLDSNILSMLRGSQYSLQNQDFLDFAKFIGRNQIQLNAMPYFLEASMNTSAMKKLESVRKCLLNYFCFSRMCNENKFYSEYMPQLEDEYRANRAYQQMLDNRKNIRNDEKEMINAIRCFLLKIYIIEFSSKKSAENKLLQLMEFVNNELGSYWENGVLLAYWYFNKQKDVVRFFSKVKPNSRSKTKDVEGMAWDIFHLWNIPEQMFNMWKKARKINVVYLATHDRALAAIARLNPIRRLCFYKDNYGVKYTYSIRDYVSEKCYSKISVELFEKTAQRRAIKEKNNYKEMLQNLETELMSFTK
mgnify:FL=1